MMSLKINLAYGHEHQESMIDRWAFLWVTHVKQQLDHGWRSSHTYCFNNFIVFGHYGVIVREVGGADT